MSHLLFNLFPETGFAEILCRTLLHSLWQALLLAAVAGGVLMVTRRSAPATRYQILLSLFFLFAIATCFTFVVEWKAHGGAAVANSGAADTFNTSAPAQRSEEEKIKHSQDALSINVWIEEYSIVIACAWVLCFIIHVFRLHRGLQHIRSIRNTTSPVPELWERKLEGLKERLGIRQAVGLRYTGRVQVPVVIGFTRPLILLPLSLLSQLPPDYIEAVLVHELAHIRRCDFAVNAFQKFVEAVFFFNPPLLWLSARLREEREVCCDQLVLEAGCDRRHYLEALLYFQEQSLGAPPYAMALGSTQNHLLNRVKRMLTQENKKLSKMEKNMLLLGLLGLTAFAFAQNPAAPIVEAKVPTSPAAPVVALAAAQSAPSFPVIAVAIPAKRPSQATPVIRVAPPAPAVADTLPQKASKSSSSTYRKFVTDGNKGVWVINTTEPDGKTYFIKKENGKITEFKVDGNAIALTELAPYQALIENLEARARESDEKRREADSRRQRAEIERQKLHTERMVAQRARLQGEREQRTAEQRSRMAAQRSKMDGERSRIEERRKVSEAKREELRAREQQVLQERQEAQRTTSEIDLLLQDMAEVNGVKAGEVRSFTLSADELTVNGEKQANAVLQKIKEKHKIGAGDSFQYQTDGKGTTRTTVVRN